VFRPRAEAAAGDRDGRGWTDEGGWDIDPPEPVRATPARHRSRMQRETVAVSILFHA
jgi:hypothetical protein